MQIMRFMPVNQCHWEKQLIRVCAQMETHIKRIGVACPKFLKEPLRGSDTALCV